MQRLAFCLFLLWANTAWADVSQEAGEPYTAVKPYALNFPEVDAIRFCSIGLGYQALWQEYAGGNASYCNLAFGYQSMAGKMTSTAINNIAFGYQAGQKITTGSGNILFGNNGVGHGLTTGSRNIYFGQDAGGNMTTGSDNILLDAEGAGSPNGGSGNVTLGGHNFYSNSFGTFLGSDSAYQDFGGNYQTVIGMNAGRTNFGFGGVTSNAVLIGSCPNSPQSSVNDSATSNSTNYVGIGRGHWGSKDTGVGYQALIANTVDTGLQVALGNNSLTANTTGTHNAALGYSSGGSITTGSNNAAMGYQVGSSTLTTGSSNILIGTSSGVTTPAAGTSNYLNINNLIVGDTSHGSLIYRGPTTVLSACGTSPTLKTGSNDTAGEVTIGTAGTSCTISFSSTKNAAPVCRISAQTTLAGLAYSVSTTALTISATGLGGDLVDYMCEQDATATNPTP